ncbi:MAG TPA: D-aminoacylase [Rhizomicrobium sp.]|jgi:N-acyl-D-amino-acid deacylase
MHDVIIRDVSIYDGLGNAPIHGDIAIDGDTIASVGLVTGSAKESVDGSGLAIAPGFIDVHTHDDFAAVLYRDMSFKIAGGVTTCVVGNCGMGAAPWAVAQAMARSMHPEPLPEWQGYRGYLAQIESQPPAVNVTALIGHGTARLSAMGMEAREPSGAELAAMKDIVAEGLEAGAVGLSSGLIYDPGRHARTQELVELAALMRGIGALYATHMRDEGTGLLESVAEAIAIGEQAGVPVQISHHKASGRAAWGLVTQSLALIENAQGRGLDVHADQYPYTAGSTILSAVFREGSFWFTPPENIVIASARSHPEWEGSSVAALAQQMGCDAPQAAMRILAEEPGATVVVHTMCEEDVRTVMRHPSTMIGSDGLPTLAGKPHPRLYGTFARVLGHYARDEHLFPLAEAIRRMTSFPAAKFGFTDRGVLRAGAKADVVSFDANTIIDCGTFENPKQPPKGIAAVYVNGALTVRDGKPTGALSGRALRRSN